MGKCDKYECRLRGIERDQYSDRIMKLEAENLHLSRNKGNNVATELGTWEEMDRLRNENTKLNEENDRLNKKLKSLLIKNLSNLKSTKKKSKN